MAAPQITGIVAQLFQLKPSATPAEVENALKSTAYRFTADFRGAAAHAGIRPEDGRSAVMTYAAWDEALGTYCDEHGSIGKDADVQLMVDVAKWGRGRFYYTEDDATIPRIFTLETFGAATNDDRFVTGVVPAANLVTTAHELSRFFEVMRCGGELDGVESLREIAERQPLAQAKDALREPRLGIRKATRPQQSGSGHAGTSSGRYGIGGHERRRFTHPGRSG